MNKTVSILEYLNVSENDFNDMVLSEGKKYAMSVGVAPDLKFWNKWWKAWLNCDEVELAVASDEGRNENNIGMEGYLLVQRAMMKIMLNELQNV